MLKVNGKVITSGTSRVLRGGVRRIVHVLAKALKENNEDKSVVRPVIAIRTERNPSKVLMVFHAEFLGKTTLIHTPNDPVPGTEGRAVCVLRTKGRIRVWESDGA